MLFSAPLEVARTKAWTLAPSATSASVRCEPMKPSAPVTRHGASRVEYSPNSRRRSASDSSVQVESGGLVSSRCLPTSRRRVARRTRPERGAKRRLDGPVATSRSAARRRAAGAFLAHKFGRNAQTDGFLAAYGVYLVLVLAAQAFRLVVVPDLTRAAAGGRLAASSRAYAIAFLVIAVPATLLAVAFAGSLGELVTGRLPQLGRRLPRTRCRGCPGGVPAAARGAGGERARGSQQLRACGCRVRRGRRRRPRLLRRRRRHTRDRRARLGADAERRGRRRRAGRVLLARGSRSVAIATCRCA